MRKINQDRLASLVEEAPPSLFFVLVVLISRQALVGSRTYVATSDRNNSKEVLFQNRESLS